MAASLSSLASDVYTLTNRPDLVSETELAIKAATLKAHQSDFYAKDLFETGVKFSTAAYIQSLPYKELIPNWRALKYFRKSDASAAIYDFLTILTPEQTVDSYGVNKENVCYVAGTSLEIRSSDLLEYGILGCYVHPDVTSTGYSSWVADEYPFAIIYEAVRVIFKTIGFDEQAAQYERLVIEQLTLLKQSNILANGW